MRSVALQQLISCMPVFSLRRKREKEREMVSVTVGRENVTLKLEGSKKFLALKDSIVILLSKISRVSTERVRTFWQPWMRIGIHMPGVLMAGTFWVRESKTFYRVRDLSKCATLHLKRPEYKKVVVEVQEDKEAVAGRMRAAAAWSSSAADK